MALLLRRIEYNFVWVDECGGSCTRKTVRTLIFDDLPTFSVASIQYFIYANYILINGWKSPPVLRLLLIFFNCTL